MTSSGFIGFASLNHRYEVLSSMDLMPAPTYTDTEICKALLALFLQHGQVRLVDAAKHLNLSSSGLHGRLRRMASRRLVVTTPVGWMPTPMAFDMDRFSEGTIEVYWQADGAGQIRIYQTGTDGSLRSTDSG